MKLLRTLDFGLVYCITELIGMLHIWQTRQHGGSNRITVGNRITLLAPRLYVYIRYV